MINIYSAIKNGPHFIKMEANELLFAEYTCMREETKFGIWSDNNYFAFITSGKKAWKSIYQTYEVNEGDIVFVKKGANLTHQFFDTEFCAVFMFVPDEFITDFISKHGMIPVNPAVDTSRQEVILRLHRDELLENYNASVRSYLSLAQTPNEQLVTLKFEELLLSLFANPMHRQLTDYFFSLRNNAGYHLRKIMNDNFAYNLKLEDYAQLCNMSLSAFKRSFKLQYQTTPAAWLKLKKLELACEKILGTELSIGQISFECGFEDTSHFIRVFKEKYQLTPVKYRQEHSMALHS